MNISSISTLHARAANACHRDRVSGRTAFVLLATLVLLIAFVAIVVVPGLARGGVGEVLGVLGIVAAVLIFERWLRRASR
jgi:hypothetical protein